MKKLHKKDLAKMVVNKLPFLKEPIPVSIDATGDLLKMLADSRRENAGGKFELNKLLDKQRVKK